MAAVNKNKLLDNATKYIQKGQIDRAIKELQKVIEADPADVRTRLKLGDLFAKKNQNTEAAEQYNLVAESYSKDGFYLKAVAVYKQILKLDSSLIDVHLKLGDLYHQLGLLSDAMSQYQIVAQHYDSKGMAKESLATLRKMVELDPENIQSRKKLAEIIAREGSIPEAIQEFQKIAEDLKAKGRLDDLGNVLESIVRLDQSNLDTVRELAGLYLERGDPKRALAKLQLCFRANPHDLSTLEMLSKAFVALGQPEKAKSVYREIAKIHETAGNASARMEAYRAILQIDPGDGDARAAVEGRPAPAMGEPSHGGFSAPSPAPQPAPQWQPPAQQAPPQRASAWNDAPASPVMQSPAPQMSGGGGGDDPQTISKLLTEADVYLKYGLMEKALDHLRGIVRRNPQNVDAHMKLKDVYLQHKDIEGAVSEICAVIELCQQSGDVNRARDALGEGLSISPGHPQLRAFEAALGGGGAPAPSNGGGDEWGGARELPASDVEISIDGDEPEVMIDGGNDNVEISVDSDVGPSIDDGVEIQVESPGGMSMLDPGPPIVVDDSVDVSVVDDVAIESPGSDDIVIEPEPAPRASKKVAPVVSLDSRRDPSSGRMQMPEPSAISPDQLLNELASAFEPTGNTEDDISVSVPAAKKPAPVAAKSSPPPVRNEKNKSIDARFGVSDEPVATVEVEEPGVTDISVDMGDPAFATDDDVAVEEIAPPKSAPKAAPATAKAAPVAAGNDDPVPSDIAEDVDEADFFVKQEIYDEAISVYKRLLKKFPGNGALTNRLNRATALLNGEPDPMAAAKPAPKTPAKAPLPPVSPTEPAMHVPSKAAPAIAKPAAEAPKPAPIAAKAAPAEETGGFDLAAELMAELDEIAEEEEAGAPSFDENEQVSVGDVLREFRKGVDKQVGTEDKQARYDLGIAYREMGLLDEAIGEFEIASGDAAKKADCLNMIGMCQRDKGALDDAIKSFSEALRLPGINDKQKPSFFYELGATLEAQGNAAKAVQMYQQVQKLDPSFRDVAEKIKELGGGAPAAPNKKISYV